MPTGRPTLITAWGETKSVSDWARDPRCNVTKQALFLRLKKHTPEEAISPTPKTPKSYPKKQFHTRAGKSTMVRIDEPIIALVRKDANAKQISITKRIHEILSEYYALTEPLVCPACHSTRFHRDGKDTRGKQRYECADCKKKFG